MIEEDYIDYDFEVRQASNNSDSNLNCLPV